MCKFFRKKCVFVAQVLSIFSVYYFMKILGENESIAQGLEKPMNQQRQAEDELGMREKERMIREEVKQLETQEGLDEENYERESDEKKESQIERSEQGQDKTEEATNDVEKRERYKQIGKRSAQKEGKKAQYKVQFFGYQKG